MESRKASVAIRRLGRAVQAKKVIPTRKNKRREQSEVTRRTLIEVSLELFVRNGYAGTTVRAIAKKAKISPGLMFHYFPSKQALLQEHAAVVERGIEQVVSLLKTSKSPVDTFDAIARMILQSFAHSYGKNLFLLANQVLSINSIPAAVKARVSPTKSIEASVPLIRRAQKRGKFRPGDPHALALAYWGALQGIAEILIWNPRMPVPKAACVTAILRDDAPPRLRIQSLDSSS
jgi:TetR/AcrR family transcriptional regulator